MKSLIASHAHNVYLKPGEVLVARTPVLVSTVLGSCVAITMFSASGGFAAICHAMLPENIGRDDDLRYVDMALQHIYDKIAGRCFKNDLEVKLFGGAKVLDTGDNISTRLTIGEQNVLKAEAVLTSLGLNIIAHDTGGLQGRKLFFCTRSGDVYIRRMRLGKFTMDGDAIT